MLRLLHETKHDFRFFIFVLVIIIIARGGRSHDHDGGGQRRRVGAGVATRSKSSSNIQGRGLGSVCSRGRPAGRLHLRELVTGGRPPHIPLTAHSPVCGDLAG